VGASGGLIIIWNGSLFTGTLAFKNEFCWNLSKESWILTNIYGPCQEDRKSIFIGWLKNVDMPDQTDWLIMGDFNFIRKPHR
jgi:hypothetical protein